MAMAGFWEWRQDDHDCKGCPVSIQCLKGILIIHLIILLGVLVKMNLFRTIFVRPTSTVRV